jgi:hypothetical protein
MGGSDMLKDIQHKYFEMQKDPYLTTVLRNLFNKNVKEATESNDSTWQEKLAYIYTYVD